jgi:uncharacterized protein (TIGR00269 family)
MREEFGCSICYLRSGIQSRKRLGNCTICGVIKRWLLNKKARELGADKLATGHNLDDEAETVLMNLLTGNPKKGINMGPTTGSSDNGFVERIKPLYFLTNADIRKYSKTMNFPVLYEPCPCSLGTFRREVRKGIAEMEGRNPGIKSNIVNNFLMLSDIKEDRSNKIRIKQCKACGEPSRNNVCKRCSLLKIMK